MSPSVVRAMRVLIAALCIGWNCYQEFGAGLPVRMFGCLPVRCLTCQEYRALWRAKKVS